MKITTLRARGINDSRWRCPPDGELSCFEAAASSPRTVSYTHLIYFRAYTNAALREVGLGDRYLEMLEPWRQILKNGLTTWAETADPARSDCHAWGASPNFELLRTVAGIDSMAPGFARVRVAPNMGQLTQVHARMPHPKGCLLYTSRCV